MFARQTSGSVVCASCGYLVGVNDAQCYNCGRRNPGLWGYAGAVRRLGSDMGFGPFVIGLSVVMFVASLLMSGGNIGMSGLFSLLQPSQRALALLGASGAWPVFVEGRWWTVLTAGWLHAGLLHIFFNMYWVRQLAPAISDLYGPGRLVIIYVVSSVAGFALSSLAGAFLPFMPAILRGGMFTVGASASIFGLLGALVYYGRRTGSSQTYQQALSYAGIMFVFGLVMSGIDNYAHAGGFLGGYLAGRVLDPLQPERINHMVTALALLVLSVIAILASVLHGLSLGY
jgi:rhomboid protease GluP